MDIERLTKAARLMADSVRDCRHSLAADLAYYLEQACKLPDYADPSPLLNNLLDDIIHTCRHWRE